MDCLFCKIVAGQIPTNPHLNTENIFAFNDIHPKAKTHILIIPKKHLETLNSATQEDADILGDLLLGAQEIAKKLQLKGYKLQMNVEKDGGQEIFHLHIHLLSNS